jgi:hypothetical protein
MEHRVKQFQEYSHIFDDGRIQLEHVAVKYDLHETENKRFI